MQFGLSTWYDSDSKVHLLDNIYSNLALRSDTLWCYTKYDLALSLEPANDLNHTCATSNVLNHLPGEGVVLKSMP